MNSVRIGDRVIGPGQPAMVVAEIGINHNGFLKYAFELIDVAKAAGCEAVKFQKRAIPLVYKPEDLDKVRQIPPDNGILANAIARGVLSAEAVDRLQKSHCESTTNGDLKWALEFTEDEYRQIDAYCKERGMFWFASPWDHEESVPFLERLNVPCHKIASPSLTDENLLKAVRQTGKPVIMGTGMSTMQEIRRAVSFLDRKNLVLLHAVSSYPPKDEHVNLRVITTLQNEFPDVPIGYSGHERGILPSVLAVGLGAVMVERHLTLDRMMWGSDHVASLEPHEMLEMVKQIRQTEVWFGDGEKDIDDEQLKNLKKLRRNFFSSAPE